MPIYEYSCQKCKAHIEIMQKVTDKPPTRHSKCGGKLEKEWSRTGFQFKGEGWYVTDYAGKKKPSDSKETSETKSDTAAPTAASQPTKGETSKAEPAKKKTPA